MPDSSAATDDAGDDDDDEGDERDDDDDDDDDINGEPRICRRFPNHRRRVCVCVRISKLVCVCACARQCVCVLCACTGSGGLAAKLASKLRSQACVGAAADQRRGFESLLFAPSVRSRRINHCNRKMVCRKNRKVSKLSDVSM